MTDDRREVSSADKGCGHAAYPLPNSASSRIGSFVLLRSSFVFVFAHHSQNILIRPFPLKVFDMEMVEVEIGWAGSGSDSEVLYASESSQSLTWSVTSHACRRKSSTPSFICLYFLATSFEFLPLSQS